MSVLPGWMYPPRAEGWLADDLDRLPEAPRHTELIDGALVFMTTPQRSWHARVVTALTTALPARAPAGTEVEREMTVRLDSRNRPEPDLLVTTAPYDPDRTWYAPEDVRLVAEVVSPESAHRDRTVKLRKYAEAGVPHHWRVEDESHAAVVHVYELDRPARAYAPTGIFRERLRRPVPFEVDIDLTGLTRAPDRTRRGRPHRHTLQRDARSQIPTCGDMPSRALTRISRLRTPAPDGRLRCPADWPGVLRQHIPWHTDGTCNETAQVSNSYPCPCCGHRVLDAMPGSYEICPVCFWEDDHVQFRWPTMPGGANKVSLVEAQRNYQEFGASDQLGRRYVRPPAEDEPLDPAWRPIDLTRLRGLGGRGPRPLARRPLGALLVAPHFLSPGPLRVMTSHIETLVRQLDGKADESYDARAELIRTGADAIPAVIDGLPSLGGFGQLTAVEVFEEVADPRCGPALIGLLDSDNPTVRERGFTEIINDLADHAQVILCSQFWRVDAGRTDGVHGPGLDREVDWTAPWEHLVEESRTWSLLEASEGEGRLVPEGLRGGPQGVGVLEFGADAGAVGAVEGCCRPAKPGALRADRERAAPPPPQVRGRSA